MLQHLYYGLRLIICNNDNTHNCTDLHKCRCHLAGTRCCRCTDNFLEAGSRTPGYRCHFLLHIHLCLEKCYEILFTRQLFCTNSKHMCMCARGLILCVCNETYTLNVTFWTWMDHAFRLNQKQSVKCDNHMPKMFYTSTN